MAYDDSNYNDIDAVYEKIMTAVFCATNISNMG